MNLGFGYQQRSSAFLSLLRLFQMYQHRGFALFCAESNLFCGFRKLIFPSVSLQQKLGSWVPEISLE